MNDLIGVINVFITFKVSEFVEFILLSFFTLFESDVVALREKRYDMSVIDERDCANEFIFEFLDFVAFYA